jgi:hypothetical protein
MTWNRIKIGDRRWVVKKWVTTIAEILRLKRMIAGGTEGSQCGIIRIVEGECAQSRWLAERMVTADPFTAFHALCEIRDHVIGDAKQD